MPLGEALDDDDYVVRLLKRDAEASKNRYVASGLASLLSGRSRAKDAPKPNARFLRNIIRETDSHNAALKAREEEESRVRLQEMRRKENGKRKREGEGREETEKNIRCGERDGRWASALAGLGRASSGQRRSHNEVGEGGKDSTGISRRSRRDRSLERRDGDEGHAHASRKEVSRTKATSPSSRKRSRSRSSSRSDRLRSLLSSPDRKRRKSPSEHNRSKRKAAHDITDDSDSDPLDSIIGPAPLPKVRARGRGAQNAYNPSTIDSRFASDYDPKTDVRLEPDECERDDWDMALEALRDRAKWKAGGAERLKAAGFTDDEVRRWEKGDDRTEDGGRNVEDVRWTKKGEGREWDRGKVLDEDGDVGSKAEWAR